MLVREYTEIVVSGVREHLCPSESSLLTIEGIDFDEFLLPVFVPRTQQSFLRHLPKFALLTPNPHKWQVHFIHRYLDSVLTHGVLKLYFQKYELQREDVDERVAQAVISIGIAFESVRPILNSELRDQFMQEYATIIGVRFGEPFDHTTVA